MIDKEQPRDDFALRERWSNFFLVFLLVARIFDQDLAVWIFGANVPDWVPYWYNGIAYILAATIIWLNRHRLSKLNIDRPFVVILILGGILFAFRPAFDIGILVGMAAVLMFWVFVNNYFSFKSPVLYSTGTWILVLLSMLLALSPILVFRLTLETHLNLQTVIAIFVGSLQSFLGTIVFEEIIFRGALWAYLKSFGISEQSAFYLQALLFWISHRQFLLLGYPYLFWIVVPSSAILFGILVWRSKSLTPSTVSHFLFNFISQLILTVY